MSRKGYNTSTNTNPSGERSPLLVDTGSSLSDESTSSDRERVFHTGQASVIETVLNISKTCMGTGTLALPFAVRQGGLVLNTLGMVAIVGWNVYSVERLCSCLELIPHNKRRQHPPQGTSTLSTVSFYALGPLGMYLVDSMFVILLVGVIVAYEDAVLSFLRDTPLTSGSVEVDALVTATIIGILSNVPDMGYLSKVSASGLSVLLLSFTVIAFYGKFTGWHLNLWPIDGLQGISKWFGCVVFGFGTVPLTYNLRESMTEPRCVLLAQLLGLAATACSYLIIGVGLLVLYPEVQSDILHELPTSTLLPTLIRLSMTFVVLMTAPLLVVPCGQLIEGKIRKGGSVPMPLRASIRLVICVLSTGISVFVPKFVSVLSLVGCAAVAVVSFVVPPILHMALSVAFIDPSVPAAEAAFHDEEKIEHTTRPRRGICIDVAFLLLGVATTIITTSFTFRSLLSDDV